MTQPVGQSPAGINCHIPFVSAVFCRVSRPYLDQGSRPIIFFSSSNFLEIETFLKV